MLIKFVRTWARLPTLLAFVTHNRVNDGQIYFELITPFQNSLTNRVSGTMSKAAGLFLARFPRFMLKRRGRCPNSTILLFFPIFRRCCAQLHDKAGSLYVDLCQTNKNKNKNPAGCCPYIQLMMKQDRCYSTSTPFFKVFPQSGMQGLCKRVT